MNIKSVSTISEILSKRQNIQPAQWESFKGHFKISDKSVPHETGGKEKPPPMVLDSNVFERLLQEKEARRIEAMELAAKMESHYNDARAEKQALISILNETLKSISANLSLGQHQLKEQIDVATTSVVQHVAALLTSPPGSKSQQAEGSKAGKGVSGK